MSKPSTKKEVCKTIEKAIKENDIETLSILKNALDEVHSTGKTVTLTKPKLTLTPENLPPDEDYESICKILRTPLYIAPSIPNVKMSWLPELWMGSFPKPDDIKLCDNGVMMPKFDGVSAGLKFVKNADNEIVLQLAQTRGVRADITSKMKLLVDSLQLKLNLYEGFKDITDLSICIRGEVVLKDKGLTQSAPAPYIAGKINGSQEVFEEAVNTMEFIPYEIMRLTKYKEHIRVTQKECFDLLKSMNQLKFEPIYMKEYNLREVQNAFDVYSKELKEPLDGIVYCSENWTYPITEAETHPSVYGKWAWKPSKEEESVVKDFEYSIGRDGKIEIMMIYDEITIDNKKYSRAKVSISRLLALDGIGIGSKIIVRLANGISPFISDFESDDETEKYELPKKCPFCNKSLKLTQGVNVTLKCQNKNCPEILLQKYKNFLKVMGFKGVAEKRIRSLDELNFKNIVDEYIEDDDFRDGINNASVSLLFQALGCGGKQSVVKMLNDTELKNKHLMKVSACKRDVVKVVKDIMEDEFMEDFYNTIRKL